MTDESATRAPLSRRTLLRATAWSVPVIAATVAAPAQAASLPAIDATGVALTFTGPEFSSEFRLNGQVALPSAPATAVLVSATITWEGTGGNAGAEGLYLYRGNIVGGDAGILGWNLTQGAADDSLHTTFVFQTTLPAGTSQATTVSSYDGSTLSGFMYGAETPNGGSAFWDGIVTIRFSATGYSDAVLTVPYVQAPVG